jgi:hypothetical protein
MLDCTGLLDPLQAFSLIFHCLPWFMLLCVLAAYNITGFHLDGLLPRWKNGRERHRSKSDLSFKHRHITHVSVLVLPRKKKKVAYTKGEFGALCTIFQAVSARGMAIAINLEGLASGSRNNGKTLKTPNNGSSWTSERVHSLMWLST